MIQMFELRYLVDGLYEYICIEYEDPFVFYCKRIQNKLEVMQATMKIIRFNFQSF